MADTARPKDRDGLRTLVALIEIQGGLVGLWAFLRDLWAAGVSVPLPLLPGVLLIGLTLGASVTAGVALWHDRRLGYALSVPVQFAQAVWVVGHALTVRISASGWLVADVFVRTTPDGATVFGWQFDAARKGGYALSFAPREETTVALNLIALAILVWLTSRLRHRPPGRETI